MAIDYVAYTHAGARVAGAMDVDSEEEAEERLWASGLIVIELRRRRESRRQSFMARILLRIFGARVSDVIVATRQMETLLRAGVALPQALRQVRDDTRNLALREAFRTMVEDVEGGDRFSRAVAQHPNVFPTYFIRMLPMAEATGELTTVLGGVLRTMERQAQVASQARRALFTPAISMVVGLVAAFLQFTFVLPQLVELLSEFGAELPTVTRVLITIANFSRSYGVYVIVTVILLFLLFFLYGTRTMQGRRAWHRILLGLPVVGPVVTSSTMFDICSTFVLLLRAGVASVNSLRTVITLVGNLTIRDALVLVEAEVTQGGRMGQAARRQSALPHLFSETLVNGEQAGALVQNLDALADFYEGETERRVQQGTGLIEPMAFLIVGVSSGSSPWRSSPVSTQSFPRSAPLFDAGNHPQTPLPQEVHGRCRSLPADSGGEPVAGKAEGEPYTAERPQPCLCYQGPAGGSRIVAAVPGPELLYPDQPRR